MSFVTPVSADEAAQETVTAQSDNYLYSNVPFSNGYNGFCLDDRLDAPGYGQVYTVEDTSAAKRIDNGTDISHLLKLLFTQCFEEIFIKTDQGYIMSNNQETINGSTYIPDQTVQRLIYYYVGSANYRSIWGTPARWDSTIKAYDGPIIPDSGYQRTLKTEMSLRFILW